ncbi:MAG: type II toxin-antitoxin system PemK/MazF family toxin [Pleurocapsa minor HA4230-MV1]|jgi:mRNA interferase MazF|nr:type II toxin-antitoxin system PemK/MazF family toxin [Pleurocapsa minor HA4230-MV1]
MPNYLKNDVILVRYPFSDLSNSKVRPAIIVNTRHISQKILIVPITSKTNSLLSEEFVLVDWQAPGLNVSSAVKSIYTIDQKLVIKIIGKLQKPDAQKLDLALKSWLGLSD